MESALIMPRFLLSSLFAAFCLLSGPVFVYGETKAKTLSQDTKAIVIKIRQRYSQINRLSRTYRKVKKDVTDESTEGGEMIAFFSGKQVVKIAVVLYGETGRVNVEYYFGEGKVIFVYEKLSKYHKPLSGKVVSVTENRYYFNEDRLIQWLEGKKKRDVNDADAQDKQTLFLDGAKELVELANSKDSP
jgi:hypothetical protein